MPAFAELITPGSLTIFDCKDKNSDVVVHMRKYGKGCDQ